jgi:hypothetical protein
MNDWSELQEAGPALRLTKGFCAVFAQTDRAAGLGGGDRT